MAKAKRLYGCTECGATFPKWAGQCGECGAWNTLVETMIESGGAAAPSSGRAGWTGQQAQITITFDETIHDCDVIVVPSRSSMTLRSFASVLSLRERSFYFRDASWAFFWGISARKKCEGC